jgi:hypothetical protein
MEKVWIIFLRINGKQSVQAVYKQDAFEMGYVRHYAESLAWHWFNTEIESDVGSWGEDDNNCVIVESHNIDICCRSAP